MTRISAAAIHLAISVGVVGLMLLGLTLIWYPPALWRMARVVELVSILALVDISLGPILTFAVFKSGKPSLKFDLGVIALLQALGLAYGAYIMFQSRPVYIVATPQDFELVYAVDIDQAELARAAPEFSALPLGPPRLVGANFSDNPEARKVRGTEVLLEGKAIAHTPRDYVAYEQMASIMLAQATPVKSTLGDEFERRMLEAVRSKGFDPAKVVYVNLNSSRGTAVILLDAATGQVLGPVDADPRSR